VELEQERVMAIKMVTATPPPPTTMTTIILIVEV